MITENIKMDGKLINFDSNYHPEFRGWLVEKEDTVFISLIFSEERGKGHFSKLLKELKEKYNCIKIPTPSNQMKSIAINKGFIYKEEWVKDFLEYIPILEWNKPSQFK